MSVPRDALAEKDYQILRYIQKGKSVSSKEIARHFKNKIGSVEYRLSVLLKVDVGRSGTVPIPIPDSSYIIEEVIKSDNDYENPPQHTGVYSLSPLGLTALEDYQARKWADRRAIMRNSVFLPIGVTIATNLIPYGIKWLLLLIQAWAQTN